VESIDPDRDQLTIHEPGTSRRGFGISFRTYFQRIKFRPAESSSLLEDNARRMLEA